ncbi:hypothetical protein scyTo_0018213, partial [Scyliorhinus torazame]|nr:hypothetical protein [Scyliorhinus torazame]
LADVCLTVSCAAVLVSILDTNQSLTDLNLSSNKLGDSGVKLLCEALRKPNCKIQKLRLSAVSLTPSCAEDLASTLRENKVLTFLNLSYNKLGDSGIKLLSTALRNPDCKIQRLQLCDIGFSASSVQDLASALSTNRSLRELDLGHNKLCDAGVKHLSKALKNQDWRIQKLR